MNKFEIIYTIEEQKILMRDRLREASASLEEALEHAYNLDNRQVIERLIKCKDIIAKVLTKIE
ncbi:MAG: hypothetical protein ABGW50_08055 [Thermococcus sp.]